MRTVQTKIEQNLPPNEKNNLCLFQFWFCFPSFRETKTRQNLNCLFGGKPPLNGICYLLHSLESGNIFRYLKAELH